MNFEITSTNSFMRSQHNQTTDKNVNKHISTEHSMVI